MKVKVYVDHVKCEAISEEQYLELVEAKAAEFWSDAENVEEFIINENLFIEFFEALNDEKIRQELKEKWTEYCRDLAKDWLGEYWDKYEIEV